MAIFKCKMCGGDLDVQDESTVCECEYCETKQTVPSADNEKKVNLFNRANRLRCNCEFDKASGVYESIAAEFPEESEAYWGLCLCKYGIEYVDDPATAKKIPTCHRTSYDSIFQDSNFDLACEYADSVARQIYRAEAKEIERLQKEILDIAKNEEPFDIFICYKETAPDGQRTKDSVLAQDIYDALTAKSYKVFFSRITLEDKLGQYFEPYIFSALNSAKVMLAIGTDYEYFNAVWVKNEWSRFLALMSKDKSKTLIPCYCDIDAYDMPEEFKHFQGQDMGKVGFVQDLVRGIGKIIPLTSSEPHRVVVQQQASGNPTVDSLIKRAMLFLEDGEFSKANEYAEKTLDANPENGYAYLVKLCVELQLRKPEELANLHSTFKHSENYNKIIRFADNSLKTDIAKYLDSINEKMEQKLQSAIENVQNPQSFIQAIDTIKFLGEHDDLSNSNVLAMEYRKAVFESGYTVPMAAYGQFVIGLRNVGTLVAAGNIEKDIQRNLSNWSNIIAIENNGECVIGLKEDGTVVTTGHDLDERYNVSDWKYITAISVGGLHTVGLKVDGTVVAKLLN